MKKFIHYHQLDMMDCGPTCLRMIAKHYGRSYTVQSLRDKAQIGKDGVSLLGIAEAAEAIGFRSIGVKVSFEKLLKEVPLPCIVHWKQNHFVVIYDIRKNDKGFLHNIIGGRSQPNISNLASGSELSNISIDQTLSFDKKEVILPLREHTNTNRVKNHLYQQSTIYIADPAKGLITYSTEEFCQGWISTQANNKTETSVSVNNSQEGVALLLEPTPVFFENDDEPTTHYGFKRILSYLLTYKSLILQLILSMVVGSSLQLLFPFLTQSVIDIGVNTHNVSFIYLVLIAQMMLMVGRLSVEFIRSWILLHISARVNLNILSDFLIKLMRLPVSFFDTKQFGDLMQRITDHQRIESFLTGQTLSVAFSTFNLVIFSVVLALYNLSIFSVFLISTILYIGWVILFLKQRRKLDFRRFDVSAKNQSSLVQLIQGMQEIKLAGADRPMRWAWERLQVRLFRLQMRGLALNQFQTAGAFAINEGKSIFITFLAAQSVINGQMTLGAMLAVQYIIGQMNSPIDQLVGFTQGLQDAKISLERMNEIHMLKDEEPNINSLVDQPLINELPIDKALQMQHVSFTYTGAGNEPVLNDINLSIPSGRTTAIVGMSGSGKTTLLKLLIKFYEPSKGEVLLGNKNSGGTPLKNISHTLWRSQCGTVMQDGFIFSDTIARNIAVGVEYIDTRRLDHAVRIANLRDFIEALPSGMHTKIGAEGNGISQGQRQRILIARAVYKDPQYIFFDEATNSLDANNEAIIMENLSDFFVGRTVIVVAHRLSTVCNADQIIVLDRGSIVEIGSHTELVAQKGNYWKLVKNQLELGT